MANKTKVFKKIVSLFLCLAFVVVSTVNVSGAERGISLQIDITEDETNGIFIVNVSDDPYYAENKPSIFVNTSFSTSVVYDSNFNGIKSTINNGEVEFTINKGGTYYVAETCPHHLSHTEGKDATCLTNGNLEYWHCSICDKYYDSDDASSEISEYVIAALGHSYSGTICSECGHEKIDANVDSEDALNVILQNAANVSFRDFDPGFNIDNAETAKLCIESDDSVDSTVKQNFEDVFKLANIDRSICPVEYYDVLVQIYDTAGKCAEVESLDGKIEVTIPLTGELKPQAGYKFKVYRQHGGSGSPVEEMTNVRIDGNNIKFKSDKFSLFAIVKVKAEQTNKKYNIPKTGIN